MDRIRQLRKERGLSQAKLAVMADMDPATLNRLERGTGNPNLKTLERVADALGVEVADFFPKGRRSSPEPTLLNGLEDEWHASSFSFREARESLEGYCEHWESVLAEGNLDDHAALELITTAGGWIPVLDIALSAEMKALAVSGEDKQSEIAKANRRYLKLFSAAIEVFQERVERDQYESITVETNVVNLQKARERLAELPSQAVG